MDPTHKDAIIW